MKNLKLSLHELSIFSLVIQQKRAKLLLQNAKVLQEITAVIVTSNYSKTT